MVCKEKVQLKGLVLFCASLKFLSKEWIAQHPVIVDTNSTRLLARHIYSYLGPLVTTSYCGPCNKSSVVREVEKVEKHWSRAWHRNCTAALTLTWQSYFQLPALSKGTVNHTVLASWQFDAQPREKSNVGFFFQQALANHVVLIVHLCKQMYQFFAFVIVSQQKQETQNHVKT